MAWCWAILSLWRKLSDNRPRFMWPLWQAVSGFSAHWSAKARTNLLVTLGSWLGGVLGQKLRRQPTIICSTWLKAFRHSWQTLSLLRNWRRCPCNRAPSETPRHRKRHLIYCQIHGDAAIRRQSFFKPQCRKVVRILQNFVHEQVEQSCWTGKSKDVWNRSLEVFWYISDSLNVKTYLKIFSPLTVHLPSLPVASCTILPQGSPCWETWSEKQSRCWGFQVKLRSQY